jgi:hypothetical protein
LNEQKAQGEQIQVQFSSANLMAGCVVSNLGENASDGPADVIRVTNAIIKGYDLVEIVQISPDQTSDFA